MVRQVCENQLECVVNISTSTFDTLCPLSSSGILTEEIEPRTIGESENRDETEPRTRGKRETRTRGETEARDESETRTRGETGLHINLAYSCSVGRYC